MSIEIDTGDLDGWLDASVAKLRGAIRPVVSKGALNVKTAMQKDLRESLYFKQVALAVNYETSDDKDGVEAEIGPGTEKVIGGGKHRTPGNLAHLAYFGGARGGGGTVRDPQLAAEDEADAFEKFLGDALGGVF